MTDQFTPCRHRPRGRSGQQVVPGAGSTAAQALRRHANPRTPGVAEESKTAIYGKANTLGLARIGKTVRHEGQSFTLGRPRVVVPKHAVPTVVREAPVRNGNAKGAYVGAELQPFTGRPGGLGCLRAAEPRRRPRNRPAWQAQQRTWMTQPASKEQTMTEKTQPTDAEIWQLYMQQPGQHKDPISFARAVLAKWGVPTPIGVEQVSLSDAQCDAIYAALDEFGQDYDFCDFGLPCCPEDGTEYSKKKARNLIREAAKGLQQGGQHGTDQSIAADQRQSSLVWDLAPNEGEGKP